MNLLWKNIFEIFVIVMCYSLKVNKFSLISFFITLLQMIKKSCRKLKWTVYGKHDINFSDNIINPNI